MKTLSRPTLQGSEILRVGDAHVVRVLEGTAYVTTEGDAHDHFLTPGDEIATHGLTLVQGWPVARVEVR